jgi:hypothetical protein
MQLEEIATSTRTSISNASEPSNASQYGILAQQLQSADLREPIEEERIGSAGSSHEATVTEPASADGVGLQEELRRLKVNDRDEDRPKPSFQRISEYENALSPTPPRKQSEGPGFKVIKKKGNRLDGPQLDKFPNGMSSLILRPLSEFVFSAYSTSHLTLPRGSHAHPIPSASSFTLRGNSRVPKILQSSHDTSRVAYCLFSVLSWSRCNRCSSSGESSWF